MTDRLADWVALVGSVYPESDAESWDNTGLQVGAPDDPVTAVLVAVDVTEATLAEAQAAGADLLLAHHPLLFRPLSRLTPETASGRLALHAARAGVAVLAVHTNFDLAVVGTTDPILRLLSAVKTYPLRPAMGGSDQVKLVTFVPGDATDRVLAAMAQAGAGVIGEYDSCSFRVRGHGTFRPSAAANPTAGQREQLNTAEEDRLEVVVPRRRLPGAVAALIAAHPYEEVAYDVLALESIPVGKGVGRLAELPTAMPLREVATRLAEGLPAPHLRVAGELDRPIRRIAACGGAGDVLIGGAIAAGADVYITGDLRHHVTLDALTMGMAVIDAGHYATEAAALPALRDSLSVAAQRRGLQARLLASATVTDPWADFAPRLRTQDKGGTA